jgi:hypothetical protein
MLKEDNSGFVNFPIMDNLINKKNGNTFIYIVAFDVDDIINKPYLLSNIRLDIDAEYITDDINSRNKIDSIFINGESIPLTTCVCVGWSEFVFSRNIIGKDIDWYATFRDLSNDGKNLYYSLRKLHNNKEVRILTFKKD